MSKVENSFYSMRWLVCKPSNLRPITISNSCLAFLSFRSLFLLCDDKKWLSFNSDVATACSKCEKPIKSNQIIHIERKTIIKFYCTVKKSEFSPENQWFLSLLLRKKSSIEKYMKIERSCAIFFSLTREYFVF